MSKSKIESTERESNVTKLDITKQRKPKRVEEIQFTNDGLYMKRVSNNQINVCPKRSRKVIVEFHSGKENVNNFIKALEKAVDMGWFE